MSHKAGELERIAVEGYHYFYPLILMDATQRVATGGGSGGTVNSFVHKRAFPPGDFRDVVRPNFDTLYSTAWLDLRDGPQVLTVGEPVRRFFMLPLLDMWTDVFAVIGTRTTGDDAGEYAIVPPGWSGALPHGMARIDAPTSRVWVLGRTQTNGVADYPAVHAVQDCFDVRPLAGRQHPAEPEASHDAVAPVDHVAALSGVEFFARAAELLTVDPPHLTDQPILSRLRRLGIEPGRPFDAGGSSPEVLAAMSAAPKEAVARMAVAIGSATPTVNGWSTRRAGIGVYGTDYLIRAAVAMIGLGANLPEDALYPLLATDEDGHEPVGEKDYVLHFDADELPPVDAFWSLTMYDGEGFTVPNRLDRYALGDRDPLVYADDGALDLLISRTSPGGPAEANWLPSPPGPLGLTLRLYGPRPEALDGRWNPPTLRRA
ncbi:DUF1254 domain-containing protein [Microbacter sp. GSS18]|nr:DUF1254 domain-containing protein [Microbacter sp. GSS18]